MMSIKVSREDWLNKSLIAILARGITFGGLQMFYMTSPAALVLMVQFLLVSSWRCVL